MGSPFVGEIRMFGGTFAPVGWAFCSGQLMPISENETLFNLIGTTYGGDGQATFALPDLQGRVPVHQGQGPGIAGSYTLGEKGGTETVFLLTSQIPAHSHTAVAQSGAGTQASPANGLWAGSTLSQYSGNNSNATMHAQAMTPAGGSQPHDNMLPYTVVSFIISLYGVYPPPN